MGTLDKTTGNNSVRKVKFVDVTGYTIAQLENTYNNFYGAQGWRIVQVIVIGNKNYIVAEKEV